MYPVAVFTLLAILFAWAATKVVPWLRVYANLRKLPRRPAANVLLGNVEIIKGLNKVHELNYNAAKTLGGVYRIRLFALQALVLNDPELLHTIVFNREYQLNKHASYRVLTKLTSGTGHGNLVSLDTTDDLWKLIRKGVAPAFAQKHIRRAFDVVRDYATELVFLLKRQGKDTLVNMDHWAMRATIDSIAKWGFETELGALQGKNSILPGFDLLEGLTTAASETFKNSWTPFPTHWPWDKRVQDSRRTLQNLYAFNRQLLLSCMASSPSPESLIGHLLALRDPSSGKQLPEEVLASQTGILFFAGHDTTGHTIAYTLYFISQHPRVEARLCEELDSQGLLASPSRPNPRDLTYEDLSQLPYLQACVKESMRLLPVAPAVGRLSPPQGCTIRGIRIPGGVNVTAQIYSMHRLYFDDPDEFKPERFLDPNAHIYIPSLHAYKPPSKPEAPAGHKPEHCTSSQAASDQLQEPSTEPKENPTNERTNGIEPSSNGTAAHSSYYGDSQPKRFLPFAAGARDCVGQSLAKMSVPTTVGTLLSHFTFKLADDFDKASLDNFYVTLRPSHGMPMYCIPRADQ